MSTEPLVRAVGQALASHGFRPHWRERMGRLGCVAFWRRCTLNTNRAVALLKAPEGEIDAGRYCQRMKWQLLLATRFCPLFYEVGLQIVLCGERLERAVGSPRELQRYVDLVSNQLVVLQSLFVVDTAARWYVAARTWGQVLTGPVQDAIGFGIRAAGFSYFEAAEPGDAADSGGM